MFKAPRFFLLVSLGLFLGLFFVFNHPAFQVALGLRAKAPSFLTAVKQAWEQEKTIVIRFITDEQIAAEVAADDEFFADWTYYLNEYYRKPFSAAEFQSFQIDPQAFKALKKDFVASNIPASQYSLLLLKKGKGIFYFKEPLLEPFVYQALVHFFQGRPLSVAALKEDETLPPHPAFLQQLVELISASALSVSLFLQ